MLFLRISPYWKRITFRISVLTFLLATPLVNVPLVEMLGEGPPSPEALTNDWLRAHDPQLLTPTQLQELYKSLINGYWVPQTGLFLSFPGTGDLRLVQQAATYDQGVVGLLLLKLNDLDKVRRLLVFYEKAWDEAGHRSGPRAGRLGFSNFYN